MSLNDYIFQKPIIQTERLILRPLVESDEVALREWLADKSIYKYWGKSASKTDKDPSILFKKEARPTKSFHLDIEHRGANKIIGEIWVYLIENDRTLVDRCRCLQYGFRQGARKMWLPAGRLHQARKDGQHMVRLLYLRHLEDRYAYLNPTAHQMSCLYNGQN